MKGKFTILYEDGSTDLVECDDYIEVKFGRYVDVDGTLYGNTSSKNVKWVKTARSDRDNE